MTLTEAQQARDVGMAQAFDHAEAVDSDWPQRAYAHLCAYAATHPQFISHDVTDGCPSPTSQKAWGALFAKAAREGLNTAVKLLEVCRPHVVNAKRCLPDNDEGDYHDRKYSELLNRIDATLQRDRQP